ncbi:LysR family transcriptional regulator [Pseudomonas abietaniphila]|uniref:LysR family transcriptional regulator n=1 Tax=Pseudomonas abietaniphila TaxID=89065 RepID=UPI000944A7BD|nr:LysR family transcriptional regulator [Pseudomonas abietaniphila]
MDSLSGITAFVQVAETRSFTEAGRLLEISSSAVGKSVARMEERLGVRLFHRSTRSVTLTAEGEMFLERCRRIIQEAEQAEIELSQLAESPRGKLRISVPLQNTLIFPLLSGFMQAYPQIELDVDLSDRMVDVIEEGFDAVIRTGQPSDSRLMARKLGEYKLELVASPGYLARHGRPTHPDQLRDHACLLHKFPASGALERWPVRAEDADSDPELGKVITCTTTDALTHLALEGLGIACLADFSTQQALRDGTLEKVLPAFTDHRGSLWMLWPSSRNATPKLRALIDYFKEHIAAVPQPTVRS